MNKFIKEIKDIRKNNNDLWMKILDIALKYNPEETKKLLKSITNNDKKISQTIEGYIND